MPAGRPSVYDKKYNDQAYKLCLLSYTDKQLADFFEVSESTINKWKLDYPEFSESIKKGKEIADGNVVESLYNRACGYTHKETKTATFEGRITDEKEYDKHYPPDTKACEIWLRNRQPTKFREKIEIDNKISGELTLNEVDYSKLDKETLLKIKNAGKVE